MGSVGSLSFAQKDRLIEGLRRRQSQSKWNYYHSRVRLTAATLAGNVYSLAPGAQVTAFGYALGQDMTAAGLAGVQATEADTNIITPAQTIAGERVIIQGISLFYLGQSDANWVKALDQNVSVKIRLNGSIDYKLGIPSMLPACGGLFGSSEAWSVAPSLPDQVSRNIGSLTNGLPVSDNFFPLPEPMLWMSAGRGDSTFNIILKVEQPVATIPQWGSAARAAVADSVAPYTPPTAAQVFADIKVVLIGCTVNPLSSY